ncbi:MAG: polyprenyl synthetase family protein [bacterium]
MIQGLEDEIKHISTEIERNLLSFFEKLPNDNMTNIIRYHMGWLNRDFQAEEGYKGKRLRPFLCSFVCKLIGGNLEDSYPAGIALELIHNFSLVHDDIQDRDIFRRGRETVWSIWGEPQGINIGDAMIFLAYKAIIESFLPLEKKHKLLMLLNSSVLKLCKGQFLDVSFEKKDIVTTEEYIEMVEGKTSAMFEASAGMGVISSGKEEFLDSFLEFGKNLGIGFQIYDDILGLWGNPKITGKPVGSDLLQNKKTYPIILGMNRLPNLAPLILKEKKDKNEVESIILELERAEVKKECKEKASFYLSKAREIIDKLNIEQKSKKLLLEFTSYLEERER